jgi:peptide/nickel transport system permease protein/oligopeptide transport system permease protein
MRLVVIFLVLAVMMWSSIFRVVRSQVLSLKEAGFVEAAKALGGGSRRIIFKHLLPNTLGPVIVLVTIGIGSVILTEAMLSYLGFGAEMTTPSWGRLLRDANPYVTQPRYLYMVMFPGIAIFMSVLGFTTMGDGLRDAIDPRMKV